MAIDNARDDDVPLHAHLGLVVESKGSGTSRVTLALTDAVRGLVAPVHGGVLATMSDVACACAIGDYDGSDSIPVSIDLHVQFFGQPKQSPLVAEGRVIHRGSRVVGVECAILDGTGRQVARAAGTYLVVRGFGDLATGVARQRAAPAT